MENVGGTKSFGPSSGFEIVVPRRQDMQALRGHEALNPACGSAISLSLVPLFHCPGRIWGGPVAWFDSKGRPMRTGLDRESWELTDGQEGNALVFFVARDAIGARVEGGFAVDEKLIMMMTVVQWDNEMPGTVRLADHGVSVGVPVIEVTDHGDASGFGGKTEEVDRFRHVLGGVPMIPSET